MRNDTTPPNDPAADKNADLVARARALGWRGQNEIARRIGVNPGHFSRAIRGQHRTRDEMLARAEKVIGAAERRRSPKRRAKREDAA